MAMLTWLLRLLPGPWRATRSRAQQLDADIAAGKVVIPPGMSITDWLAQHPEYGQ